jgi:hypothetical protein
MAYTITTAEHGEWEADDLAGARAAARCLVEDDGAPEATITTPTGRWVETGTTDDEGRYLVQTVQGR